MQRLGHEVWAIHTVQFSNHTGYGAWKGRVYDGPMIEELVEGMADRGACSAAATASSPAIWARPTSARPSSSRR